MGPVAGSGADLAKQVHAREIDAMAEQCYDCRFNKPQTPTKDCEIKIKLIKHDAPMAWKHRHLFLNGDGGCKKFQAADKRKMQL